MRSTSTTPMILVALLVSGCGNDGPTDGGGYDGPKLGSEGTNRPAGIEIFDSVPPSRDVALDALLEIQKNQGQIVSFGADGEAVVDVMLSFGGSNENVVESLKYFPHLESVYLPTIATDEWVAHLKPLRELKSVGLPKSVTDAGLVYLEGMPRLVKFEAYDARITDAGVQSLATIPTLESIVLKGTDITDDSLSTLATLPKLTFVNVSNTAVTEAAVARFETAKPNCKVLAKYLKSD